MTQNADYGHVLHVTADVPHVVDDYGNEVHQAELYYRLDCIGVAVECQGLIECDCTHPDDDEQFEDADGTTDLENPRYKAYLDALSVYEDAHPEYGWELSGDCWAKEALTDWEPDGRWEPGVYPVKVKADRSWGGPEDAALILIPVGSQFDRSGS